MHLPGGGPYGFSFASNLTISEVGLRSFSFEEVSSAKIQLAKYHKPERTSNGTIELYGASSNICSRRNSSVLGTFLALGSYTALGTDNLQDSRVLKDIAPISLQLVRICEICLRESGMSRRSLQDFNLQLV